MAAHSPPGWPPGVPPPDAPGWERRAVAWLLDQCPPDYRNYAGWTKQPIALAWLADLHVAGQVEAMRTAYRTARVELGPHLTVEGLADVLAQLESEGMRLVAVQRGTDLILRALQGEHFVPRL